MTRDELDPWVEGYLTYLAEVKKLRSGTIRDVRCSLRRIARFMTGRKPGRSLWELRLEDFLAWLEAERAGSSSVNSLAKQLSHVRGLLDYAWRSGRADRNVLDGFSLQDQVTSVAPAVLTFDEAAALVCGCGTRNALERRDRVIVLILYGCGLRTGELVSLDVPDVDIERQEILVRHAKGYKQRTLPVPRGVWTEILAYLAERGGKRGPLFRSQTNKARISQKEVGEIIKRAAKRAGIGKRVTAKTLRHTFASHLMERGVDIAIIASLMGHRTPTETGVYLHALPDRKEVAVSKLHTNGHQKEGDE